MDLVQCPNSCGELTKAISKNVEFDDGDNDIKVSVYLEWCPECRYIHYITDY